MVLSNKLNFYVLFKSKSSFCVSELADTEIFTQLILRKFKYEKRSKSYRTFFRSCTCIRFAAADENIAFINAGYLFQNHPDRQAVADKLDAEFKPMADKLAASKKEIDDKIVASRKKVEAKIAALQKDAPRLRQAEIQKRQEEIT